MTPPTIVRDMLLLAVAPNSAILLRHPDEHLEKPAAAIARNLTGNRKVKGH